MMNKSYKLDNKPSSSNVPPKEGGVLRRKFILKTIWSLISIQPITQTIVQRILANIMVLG